MRRGKWLKEGERGFKDGNQGGGEGWWFCRHWSLQLLHCCLLSVDKAFMSNNYFITGICLPSSLAHD